MKKIIVLLITIFLMVNAQSIGRTITAGWTTVDWQFSGPVYTRCRVNSLINGIHICWVGDNGPKYNYYSFLTNTWNWPNGMNPISVNANLGGLDYDPINGSAEISLLTASGPCIAKDQQAGAGVFEYCYGPAGYGIGPIGTTNNQAIHITMNGYYSRIQPWCNWMPPIVIITGDYTGYNIATSKMSNKVLILWISPTVSGQDQLFFSISNDNGNTWGAAQLPFPPSVYLVPSYASLFAMFDNQDNLHIVASVSDTAYAIPCEIWHYCPLNNPQWTLVHYYNAQTLNAPVGYNAVFATRPSIIQDPTTGYFYVAWEQFDSLNYESSTNLARADIWVAELRNNGQTVYAKRKITEPNTTSKRFPIVGGVFADTLVVNYLIDSVAGFSMYSQGRITNNPVICHFVPIPFQAAIDEQKDCDLNQLLFDIVPNPFTSQSIVNFSIPIATDISIQIYDESGRIIETLVSEHKQPGVYSYTLNSSSFASGIYFCALKVKDKFITKKIIKAN
ncbi:MAG: T9SS type A sorting domain-containing protein [candidate division WOR-3 bacterium]